MSDTIAIIRFRLKEGKTKEDWLKMNEKVNEWVLLQPGFRFRSLSETEDGKWTVVTQWESMNAADLAEKNFRLEMEDLIMPFVDAKSLDISRGKSHMMQGAAK